MSSYFRFKPYSYVTDIVCSLYTESFEAINKHL
jgi:hypothetical protein